MTALEYFCHIIQSEMNLADDQVYLWDQKIDIPNDYRLYVAVGILNCKPFGSSRQMDGSGAGLNEVLSVNMLTNLSVDIFSRGPDARDRKEEIILALNSTYSEQVQEANGFAIAVLSNSFVNLSMVEGAAIPYRFNIGINIQYQITKSKGIAYYDSFTDTIITDPKTEA